MARDGSAVYCTLLLSDHYLPGAMVLAHSLRDNGTSARLCVLYTPDTLRPSTIHELQTVYDELIPVHPMTNNTPANLWLMDRPDLIAAFTKIELWRQTQFRQIVYIDCDVVALRAPDELLDLEAHFAAAPDVGWPDCFNSGVMVLRPNLQDYFALRALAERGISFDGADQGLLNMHFRDWQRLSFTYNCTPSANYQYIPAYKHFQSTISMIHFIGAQKPWNMPRQVWPAETPYNQLLGRWWAVYDKHYRHVASESPQEKSSGLGPVPETSSDYQHVAPVQSPYTASSTSHAATPHVASSYTAPCYTASSYTVPSYTAPSHAEPFQPSPQEPLQPVSTGFEPPSESQSYPQPIYQANEPQEHDIPQEQASFGESMVSSAAPVEVQPESKHTSGQSIEPFRSVVPQYVRGEEHMSTYIQPRPDKTSVVSRAEPFHHIPENQFEIVPSEPPHIEPQSHLQTEESVPAATEEFHAPPPEPEVPSFEAPKIEWDASREPPPLNTKPEGIALKTKTYTMSEDHQLFQPPSSYPEAPKNMYYEVPSTKPEPQKATQVFPWESRAPVPTRVFPEPEQSQPASPEKNERKPSMSSITSPREESGPSVYSGPSIESGTSWTSWEPAESWETYNRSNAWDEVPEIQKYIQSLQQARKPRIQVLSSAAELSTRVTDFPSEIERPSLPVTPAPIRPGPATVSGEHEDQEFPTAQEVPKQEEWNPVASLEELRRRQSAVLVDPDVLRERIERSKYREERGQTG